MNEIVNNILNETKLAYKESVKIENKIIEDKLIRILVNVKYLQDKIEEKKLNKINKIKSISEIEENEIEKVKRKVPLWLKKNNQINYKILKSFMDLSNNNSHYVNVTTLETHCNVNDPKKFLSNYNLLKSISQKNHAKVFEEKNGRITLWEPVSEILVEYFK